MKKVFFVGLVLIVAVLYMWKSGGSPSVDTIAIAGKEYAAIYANTDELRMKGLSGREGLDDNTVMVFTFNTPGMYGFWMKDMLFPIDIIWINDERKVVHIERNVDPSSYPKPFYPTAPASMVIESEVGVIQNIAVGDTV